MENKVVSLNKENNDRYLVYHEDNEVGYITINRFFNHVEIEFECYKPYQRNHYLSNAVYLLTNYLHEEESINDVYAYVNTSNDLAIHILEHSGYFIEKEENDIRLYHHKKYLTKKGEYLDNSLYLAGGCFWGMEKAFKKLKGITSTCCGYANGNLDNPSYEDIIRNETGYKETVRITYNPSIISLETIMKAYFICVDPTNKDGQGIDIGDQYKTGVYFTDLKVKDKLEQIFEIEKKKYDKFYVELKELKNFYEAEEYHQDYLTKHPDGYCHINFKEISEIEKLNEIIE